MKFSQLANEVMSQRDTDGIRGLDREMSRLRCHILTAAFAEFNVTEITSQHIREWLRAMAQKDAKGPGKTRKLSRQTISRCLSLVSAIFAEAIERESIQVNPCAGVKSKKRVDEVHHAVQKNALLSGIAKSYRPRDEEGEKLPGESTLVQLRAEPVVSDFYNGPVCL